jgi:hypothetical protein
MSIASISIETPFDHSVSFTIAVPAVLRTPGSCRPWVALWTVINGECGADKEGLGVPAN